MKLLKKLRALTAAIVTVQLVIAAGLVWLVFSFGTSFGKSVTGKCDQTWPVESVLAANWFCPEDGGTD